MKQSCIVHLSSPVHVRQVEGKVLYTLLPGGREQTAVHLGPVVWCLGGNECSIVKNGNL